MGEEKCIFTLYVLYHYMNGYLLARMAAISVAILHCISFHTKWKPMELSLWRLPLSCKYSMHSKAYRWAHTSIFHSHYNMRCVQCAYHINVANHLSIILTIVNDQLFIEEEKRRKMKNLLRVRMRSVCGVCWRWWALPAWYGWTSLYFICERAFDFLDRILI